MRRPAFTLLEVLLAAILSAVMVPAAISAAVIVPAAICVAPA